MQSNKVELPYALRRNINSGQLSGINNCPYRWVFVSVEESLWSGTQTAEMALRVVWAQSLNCTTHHCTAGADKQLLASERPNDDNCFALNSYRNEQIFVHDQVMSTVRLVWKTTGKVYCANIMAMEGLLNGLSPGSESLFEVTVYMSCWKVNQMTERDSKWLQEDINNQRKRQNDYREMQSDQKETKNRQEREKNEKKHKETKRKMLIDYNAFIVIVT